MSGETAADCVGSLTLFYNIRILWIRKSNKAVFGSRPEYRRQRISSVDYQGGLN